jgi:hypothetical protein
VILNAQLESILSIESYAAVAHSAAARDLARKLLVAARRLLPRFDLGCWARYELGGPAASLHYQIYHVELLRQLAATHADPIWRRTYLRWRRCLPPTRHREQSLRLQQRRPAAPTPHRVNGQWSDLPGLPEPERSRRP